MKQHVSDDAAAVGTSDRLSTAAASTALDFQEATKKPKKRLTTPILLQLAAMVGIGALLYPSAANWFATMGHSSEISDYEQDIEQLPETARLAELEAATAYNAHMPSGALRDPYTSRAAPGDLAEDAAYRSYLDVLHVSDNGVIGEVDYPRLGISLPVYHGTSDEVLTQGVGHLYGSSLPTGGPSTHSVMTSHSGLVHASLFTNLPDAVLGDTFTVTVLGEQHYYEVKKLETVLPEQTESLRIIDDQDWVTLITCTPIGINSHRLLVQAERVPPPSGDTDRVFDPTLGFPWWAFGFLAGSGAVAYLLFAPPRKNRLTASHHPDTNEFQKAEHQ